MHPTDEALIGWVLGDEGEAVERVRRHVAGPCPACAGRVLEIERVLATMRSDQDPEPPEAWVRRAVALWRRSADGPGLLERIRRWGADLLEETGRLVADSATPSLAPAGLRSLGAARRLRFEAEGVELDLDLEPTSGGIRLTGQFAALHPEPVPLAGARFLVVTRSGAWQEGEADPLGEFDARADDAVGLQIRVIHRGRVVVFEVPARDPE